jgi:hypothetical protein
LSPISRISIESGLHLSIVSTNLSLGGPSAHDLPEPLDDLVRRVAARRSKISDLQVSI